MKKINPYPRVVRRILRRLLPPAVFENYFVNHEKTSLEVWRILAAKVPASDAILDIGAFHGEYALAAREANHAAPIFAFEPDVDNLAHLKRNCHKANIGICDVAVGESTGTARFLLSHSKMQGHVASAISPASSTAESRPVAMVSLDDWADRFGAKPDLVKMDVEGGEPQIIRGAQRLLKKHRPKILVEVLSKGAGERLHASLPIGYQFFSINERGAVRKEGQMHRRYWHSRNWLLLPGDAVMPAEMLGWK